jgi:hypothetical protein
MLLFGAPLGAHLNGLAYGGAAAARILCCGRACARGLCLSRREWRRRRRTVIGSAAQDLHLGAGFRAICSSFLHGEPGAVCV